MGNTRAIDTRNTACCQYVAPNYCKLTCGACTATDYLQCGVLNEHLRKELAPEIETRRAEESELLEVCGVGA